MHYSSTDSVLFFLEFNFLDKILLREDILTGLSVALKSTSFLYVDVNCVKNILIFLEIENDIIDEVILDSTNQQKWQVIIEFLNKNKNQILRKRNLSPFDEVVRLKQNDPSIVHYLSFYKNEAEQKAGFWEKIWSSHIWGYSKLIFLSFFACKFFLRISTRPLLATNFEPLAAETRILELVEVGHYCQSAGIGHAVFPRPLPVHLRRVSTVTSAVAREEVVEKREEVAVENQEVAVENEEVAVENEEVAVENQEVAVENQEVESKKSIDKNRLNRRFANNFQVKFGFDYEFGKPVISGDSSFSSETQSQEPSSSTSGFYPTHELERTQSEGFQAKGVPGFYPTVFILQKN